jgi:hypothetical protein
MTGNRIIVRETIMAKFPFVSYSLLASTYRILLIRINTINFTEIYHEQ